MSAHLPVWQAVAAVLLGVVAVWLLKKETVQEKIVQEIQIRTDTVWQEKILWRERVVWKERVVI